ncbi:hypothetical protein ANN_25941 [Periplaneta americana]|uniref:Uncharacterized protein n=1 Tax=Periplaneta americana TaxID=6978 RepID=A0ABQ8S532_PERAM|nr:hypothetical protein ANN_25941 [Periplaneta americana]
MSRASRYPPYLEAVSSIRNLRTRYAVVIGTHNTWAYHTLNYVNIYFITTYLQYRFRLISYLKAYRLSGHVAPHAYNQSIPNLTGPVDNNDVTLQRNRNKTFGRIDGCHGDCIRKIFGAKRDEVTGEWRKLHNAELHEHNIQTFEMGRTCSTYGRIEKCIPLILILSVQFKVCHGSLYIVTWLADEPREFNLPTLPQRCITYLPEKLPSKYGVHSEEYLLTDTYVDSSFVYRLFSVDGIGDNEIVFGEMRPRICHRLPDIRLTVRKKPNQLISPSGSRIRNSGSEGKPLSRLSYVGSSYARTSYIS